MITMVNCPLRPASICRSKEMAFLGFEVPSSTVPTETRSSGNWVFGREGISTYTTFKINFAKGNIGIVEAPVARLSGILEVDVAVKRLHGVWIILSDSRSRIL